MRASINRGACGTPIANIDLDNCSLKALVYTKSSDIKLGFGIRGMECE
jgi:hypothetical protein